MKLAIVFGDKGTSIKTKLASFKDNLTVHPYNTVDDFIVSATQRGLDYDRILLLSVVVQKSGVEETLDSLLSYWREVDTRVGIVLLCNSGKDDDLAKKFTSMFGNQLCTSMSIPSITVNTLGESAVAPIAELNKKYGLVTNYSYEVEEDTIVVPNVVPNVTEPSTELSESTSTVVPKVSKELSTSNFIGKLKNNLLKGNIWGKKSSAIESSVNKISEPDNEVTDKQLDSNIDNTDWESEYESNLGITENSYINTNNVTSQDSFSEESLDTSDTPSSNTEHTSLPSEYNIKFPDDIDDDLISNDASNLNSKFDTNTSNMESYNEYMPISDKDLDSTSKHNDKDYLDNLTDQIKLESASELQDYSTTDEIEEDFGNIVINHDKGIQDDFLTSKTVDLEEVTVEMGNINISAVEQSYRQQTETPKEIVREVIKEVAIKGNSVLDSIYKGKVNKIILVTGDRGSGITTTCLDIAKAFSEKVPVLYFDCDTDTHGLLSYIEYDQFIKYDTQHMQGVKLCKNSKSFSNCVVHFDNNLDLLTSNYDIITTDKELELTQSVVSEVAHKYGIVVVDCPIDKLPYMQDLILQSNVVLCVEASKRGYMNMLCKLENSELTIRYKRSIVSKGTLIVTKVHPKLNLKQLVKYITGTIEFDEINWLSMQTTVRPNIITSEFLQEIIEG